MTRLHPAAPAARTLRALIGLGAAFILAVVASGCAGSQPPAPTPDPFVGLADRSDQAFRQGLEAYGQGQYRAALTSFETARTLSPSVDPRIDQMIERSRAAMAPTATPVPPTPTEVPAAPTATPVAMSTQTPDTDLGQRYFGQVTLAMVPGRDADAPAASQFFFQDQIGLHIGGLKQHLRLPFALRVFKTDTGTLVADVRSDDSATPSAAPTTVVSGINNLVAAAAAGVAGQTATPVATPGGRDLHVARFWDTYVWYHAGGEDPGSYRVELYANGVLTNSFDYTVGTVPVTTPEPTVQAQPTAEPVAEPVEALPPFNPTPSLPSIEDLPPPPAPPAPPAPAAPAPAAQPRQARPAPVPPTATPQPTPIPSPTPIPTPATASSTLIGGLPAGLDVNANDGRVFIADGSGVIWINDPQRPTTFNRPVNVGHLPVDLAVDSTTGYVFVSARNESSVLVLDGSGRRLSTIQMPVAPGDLQVDSALGLVYVVLPERQALGVIDGRAGRMLRTIEGLPQITSLALDPDRHTLYASHLAGQLTVIDTPSSQVTSRMTVTGVGLSSVATSRGLAYAVNTASHELAVVEPFAQTVSRYVLPVEPAAVAASEDNGSVYVLASKPNTILRIDPTEGLVVGQVSLTDRSGRFGVSVADQSAFQGLRSRIVVNRADESLYVTLPEAGSMSIVPSDLFPALNRSIPWVETPDAPVVASIPGVSRPAAAPLPPQPAPFFTAQAPADDSNTDQEAN